MDSFWEWAIEPFKKPRYLMTWLDDFRIAMTIIVILAILIGLMFIVIGIVDKVRRNK